MLEQLRERVRRLNEGLECAGLAIMPTGNVSARDPASGRIVIKPSGVPYNKLTQESMVVVSPEGEVLEGRLRPSLDMATHLYVYRERPRVHGIAHTHSNFATAFAVAGRPIPVALTTVAEQFGGSIALGNYALTEGEEIGKEIIRSLGDGAAILMRQHGVYTIGETPEAALKTAVMVEDAAKTCFLGLQLGPLPEIPAEEVARIRARYLEEYGQEEE